MTPIFWSWNDVYKVRLINLDDQIEIPDEPGDLLQNAGTFHNPRAGGGRSQRRRSDFLGLWVACGPSTIRGIVFGKWTFLDMLLLVQTHQLSVASNVRSAPKPCHLPEVVSLILSSCCLNVCSGQLLVSTVNKVLLGIIKKGCGCCSGPFMVVEDEAGKDIFHIKVDCCQWANICPRLLKCKSEVVYTITNGEGKQVGRVTNIYRTCFSSICCLRDDFEVVLDGV